MPQNPSMSKDMSPDQERHIGEILYFFANKSHEKYRKGVIEHGTNLWDLSDDELLECALEEVIDLSNYLLTILLKRKRK